MVKQLERGKEKMTPHPLWEKGKYFVKVFMAADLLLALCMLFQELADMLFHIGLTFELPCTERFFMGPLVLLIS